MFETIPLNGREEGAYIGLEKGNNAMAHSDVIANPCGSGFISNHSLVPSNAQHSELSEPHP